MSTQDFLVELGTEELPPKALKQLAHSFLHGIESGLKDKQLGYHGASVYASPRRLAVLVLGLDSQQPDSENQLFGPPVNAAFDGDGNPTKAAVGFARKCKVSLDELSQIDTGKGIKLAYTQVQKGLPTEQLLPALVTNSLEQLPIPKRMRWGSERVEFVRPTHWLLMLFGQKVIECNILGQTAGQQSFGHRFHHNKPIVVREPSSYLQQLKDPGYVIADMSERKALIEDQIKKIAVDNQGQAVIDSDLLDEVTGLVEWPVALVGHFDESFLRLPEQALICSMKEHQKYFHMIDDQGKLLPNFITLCNIESSDPAQVVSGNERVIRPRLSDAAFFFDTDKKTPLADRLSSLDNIVFQAKLGTVFAKSERISKLAGQLAGQISADTQAAKRAGLLSKADLVTLMVGEFPKLQGLMGQNYALLDGEGYTTAQAIYEHYLPRFSGDEIPQSPEGCAVSIADKLDTVTGLFAIGQPPTGDKDPFGLRRAALGVLRIILEKELDLDLLETLELAIANYQNLETSDQLAEDVFDFMLERFRTWYQEEGISADIFQAVHARKPTNPLDLQSRIYAVSAFTQLDNAAALAAANKRVTNLLNKIEDSQISPDVSAHLLEEPVEKELAALIATKDSAIQPLLKDRNYQQVLESLAELRPQVDQFFDSVMVMVDDDSLRLNRLALLKQLRGLFLEVADISLLQMG